MGWSVSRVNEQCRDCSLAANFRGPCTSQHFMRSGSTRLRLSHHCLQFAGGQNPRRKAHTTRCVCLLLLTVYLASSFLLLNKRRRRPVCCTPNANTHIGVHIYYTACCLLACPTCLLTYPHPVLLCDFCLYRKQSFNLNWYKINAGTRIGQASECFVYWKDPVTNDTWGLNFTSPADARAFRECCVSRIIISGCNSILGKKISK